MPQVKAAKPTDTLAALISANFRSPAARIGRTLPFAIAAPSWPCLFAPQHHASSFVVTTHACVLPVEIERTLRSPAIGSGVEELAVAPLPSMPFAPQQCARSFTST